MFRKKGNRAQSATEYALLLAVLLASFIGMQTYAKRGIQAVIKNNIDEFGPQETKDALPEDVLSTEEASKINILSESKVGTIGIRDGNGARQTALESTTSQEGENTSSQLSKGYMPSRIVVDLGARKKADDQFVDTSKLKSKP